MHTHPLSLYLSIQTSLFSSPLNMQLYASKPLPKSRNKFHWEFLRKFRIFFPNSSLLGQFASHKETEKQETDLASQATPFARLQLLCLTFSFPSLPSPFLSLGSSQGKQCWVHTGKCLRYNWVKSSWISVKVVMLKVNFFLYLFIHWNGLKLLKE